jgi:cobalt-zinc-cadmium efflux system protein
VKESIDVLIQAVPKNMDSQLIEQGLKELPEIDEVGHFHAWTLTDDTIIATVHVTPAIEQDPILLPAIVARWLKENHAVNHVTVQVDPRGKLQKLHL